MFERHEKIKGLGKGSYGEVFLVKIKDTKELVCLKSIDTEGLDEKG